MTGHPGGRHTQIVERGYQFRFLLRLAAIFAAGAFLLFLALFLLFSRDIEGGYATVFYALRHMASFLMPIIAFSVLAFVLVVCGATAAVCVYGLHKIAGPLYRMERVMEGYLSGDTIRPVFFRHGDQIAVLSTAFNGFVSRLREDRQKWLAAMDHAERLCLQDAATCRAEMIAALSELELLLSKYR